MSKSVCMATFNGSRFVREQIESIISQISFSDELIIVDDCSTDDTVSIVKSFRNRCDLKIVCNLRNLGVNDSFETAIKLAKNDYIFLADQDDLWPEGRVSTMLNELRCKNVDLVSGNSIFINEHGGVVDFSYRPLRERDSGRVFFNFLRIFYGSGSYYGCAMAFTKTMKEVVIPFPRFIESHDLWIAKAALMSGKCKHIEQNVILRRLHSNNLSLIKRSLFRKVLARMIFTFAMFILAIRLCRKRVFV